MEVCRLIISFFNLAVFSQSAIGQVDHDDLTNSYWLTDNILITGYGQMEMDMVAAIRTEKGIVIIDSGISPSSSELPAPSQTQLYNIICFTGFISRLIIIIHGAIQFYIEIQREIVLTLKIKSTLQLAGSLSVSTIGLSASSNGLSASTHDNWSG